MLRLSFDTANAAFTDDPAAEAARILRQLADRVEGAGGRLYDGPVRDLNGNRIGKIEFNAEAGQ